MNGGAYLSSQDSALLRRALRCYKGRMCLEIGAGNCGTLAELAERFWLAVGTDLVLPSAGAGRGEFVLADGASCFRDSSFDLVAFNPPYLESEELVDRAVDGGRGGVEVPLHFMREALRVVKKRGGRVVMLLPTAAPVEPFEAECRRAGARLRRVQSERLFFEELSVFEAFLGECATQ
jgi:release factor glutamine methyltransferase